MEKKKKPLEILTGGDEKNATYLFRFETHTLGNSLRYMLMKDKEVEFCGYTIPHPIIPEMKLRLQTKTNANKVLEKGLNNLMKVSEHILKVFDETMDDLSKMEVDDDDDD